MNKNFILEWNTESETGVLWQDIQHKNLFEYIFLARDALLYQDQERVKELLNYLKSYVKQHFATEEAYMRVFNDPEQEHHIEEHNKFRARLNEIIADISDETSDHVRRQAASLLEELWVWYLEHIRGIDISLGSLIKKHDLF